MPKFSSTSLERLNSADEKLQDIFHEVIKYFDCTILTGHRTKENQHKAFVSGASKIDWPNGKHNSYPSKAVDVMPYPIDWNDWKRICYFAGFVMAIAKMKGYNIRWGHDWDGDTDLHDQKFNDGPHFELIGD